MHRARAERIPVQPGAGTQRHPSLKLQSGAAGQGEGKVGASARGPDRPVISEPRGGGWLSGEGSLPRRTC